MPITTKVVSSWRGVFDTTLCDKVCRWLAAGRLCSPFFDWSHLSLDIHPNEVYLLDMDQISKKIEGLSWSRSYGSWIYNYQGNQCLSPLIFGSSSPTHGEVYSIQHYVIKFVSDLLQVGGFLWLFWFPPPIKLTATI